MLAAVVITVLVVAIVTAKIGPGLDSEELHDLGLDDRLEEIQEREERQKALAQANRAPCSIRAWLAGE